MARAIICEPVDVVLVGAGFGGAAFCKCLSERVPSLRIVCLERGGWVDPATMPAHRRDWQRAVLSQWATSPNLRLKAVPPSSSADYPVDDTASAFKPLMWNGVGGSTVNWAGRAMAVYNWPCGLMTFISCASENSGNRDRGAFPTPVAQYDSREAKVGKRGPLLSHS